MRPDTVVNYVDNYDELKERIRSLQRKSRGRQLVFRGQTDLHDGRIVPSVARPESSAYKQDIHTHWWWLTVDILAEMVGEYVRWKSRQKNRHSATEPSQESSGQRPIVGNALDQASALLQHYGARSSFVDVTESLNVALWFSHHRHRMEEQILLPLELPVIDRNDLSAAYNVAWYEPAWKGKDRDFGYLFVLAPNQPSAGRALQHGDLLRLTPNVMASRLARQRAALISADLDENAGDLSEKFLEAVFSFRVSYRGMMEWTYAD